MAARRRGAGAGAGAGAADEVVDAQGRRRFHGAFTGGFSAGYFNTVGSQEGWVPQTGMRSTKDRQRAAAAAAAEAEADAAAVSAGMLRPMRSGDSANAGARLRQRPEDFMDEEDGILGQTLSVTRPDYEDADLDAELFGATAERAAQREVQEVARAHTSQPLSRKLYGIGYAENEEEKDEEEQEDKDDDDVDVFGSHRRSAATSAGKLKPRSRHPLACQSDGRPPPAGFVLVAPSSDTATATRHWAAPTLPRGWRPRPLKRRARVPLKQESTATQARDSDTRSSEQVPLSGSASSGTKASAELADIAAAMTEAMRSRFAPAKESTSSSSSSSASSAVAHDKVPARSYPVRVTKLWAPAPLLCKRFNVPVPNHHP